MLGTTKAVKRKKNVGLDSLEIDLSKRFKYEGPKTQQDIYPLMYHLQRKEYSQFLRGAKSFAIKKITDKPRERLESMIDLREEILSLGNDIAARVDNLKKLIQKNQYDEETDTGLLQVSMSEYEAVLNVNKEELHSLVEGELDRT